MSKIQKNRWTKRDLKVLKSMVRDGKSNGEISEILGRTTGAIGFKKSQIGLKPRVKRVAARVESVPVVSTRDQAKVMARTARQIARANGKRITMAMFFVETI